jgi:heptosyltransferase-2
LVRGVNWLGDAVLSSAGLMRLREARPQAHITLLTPAWLAPLWAHHPAVDAVLTFEPGESLWAVARRIREGRFDLALVFPNSPRSALEVFLARVPCRVGYARRWRRWLLTHPVPPRPAEVPMHKRSSRQIRRLSSQPHLQLSPIPPAAHHVHQYLALTAVLGANPDPVPPLISVLPDEVRAIEARFGFLRAEPRRPLLLGLNAGAAYGPAKQWPADRFAAVAAALQQQLHCHWWILGSRTEEPKAMAIAQAIRHAGHCPPHWVHVLAGRTTLRELCAALKACDVVLTNDSGPMHLAAAVGTPVVAIFGSTSPELTGPGLPGDNRHVVIRGRAGCAPCFRRRCPIDHRCMQSVTVDQVVAAVRDAVARLP